MPLNLKQDMYDMYYSWQGGFLYKANIEKYYGMHEITLYNLQFAHYTINYPF